MTLAVAAVFQAAGSVGYLAFVSFNSQRLVQCSRVAEHTVLFFILFCIFLRLCKLGQFSFADVRFVICFESKYSFFASIDVLKVVYLEKFVPLRFYLQLLFLRD